MNSGYLRSSWIIQGHLRSLRSFQVLNSVKFTGQIPVEMMKLLIIKFCQKLFYVWNLSKCKNGVWKRLSFLWGNWKDIPSYFLQSTISIRLVDLSLKQKFFSNPGSTNTTSSCTDCGPSTSGYEVLKLTRTHSVKQGRQVFNVILIVFFCLKTYVKSNWLC